MSLEEQISRAVKWGEASAERIDEAKFQTSTRTRVAVALLHLAIEHQRGMVVLVMNGIHGSALALFRPQFEAFVRGVWINRCASENEVQKFLAGGEPPRLSTLIAEIEALGEFAGKELSGARGKFWKSLCDYTHGGAIQVKARVTADSVESNYNPEHVGNVLEASAALSFLVGRAIAQAAEDEQLALNLLALHKEIYQR